MRTPDDVQKQGLFELRGEDRKESTRAANIAEVNRLKAEHEIWTHNAPGAGNWLAFCVPACRKLLKGYGDEVQTMEPIELFASYSRLIDESGLTEDFHPTELSAVRAVVSKLCGTTRGEKPQNVAGQPIAGITTGSSPVGEDATTFRKSEV